MFLYDVIKRHHKFREEKYPLEDNKTIGLARNIDKT
jgi:hypothetical protein